MPQSLIKNLVHLVYSTKHRQPWLPDDVRDGLFAYQAGIFKQWESPALVIGGMDDHVHALFSLSKNYALKKIVEEVKKGSSKWMKTDGTKNREEQRLPLAEWVRRLLCERVERAGGASIHRESERAPSQDDVSGGIAGPPHATRNGIRRALRVGLINSGIRACHALSGRRVLGNL